METYTNPQAEYVNALLYNGINHTDVQGEFSLPDYLPDVRRILRVTADARVTGRYMNGEKLELEGNHLWQERKRLALEKIRIGESKMSFPLGLLLMALLLVTAGPAMMQMG